jgi:hypothetical protein
MTRPHPRAALAPRSGTAVATATVLLVAAGAGGWSRLLGTSPAPVAPLAALAALTAALAAGWLSKRLAAGVLAVWVPAAVWATGVPAGQLLPPAWPWVVARLAEGAGRLTTATGGPTASRSWPLAAWLLAAATVWVGGAALAASRPSSIAWRASSFGVLATPWITALLLGTMGARQPDQTAAWPGAAVLLAGLLWATAGRLPLRRTATLGLLAALVSVGTAQVAGPRTRWFAPASPAAETVGSLQTEPTYGPVHDHPSGATLLEVTAPEPYLWRMRVLSLYFGPGWRIGYLPDQLPQPAAMPVQISVQVRSLHDDLAVAPGQIGAVHANRTAHPAPGEAWQLTPPPHRGDTYQVQANVVSASAQQLQHAPTPTDPRLHSYTRLTPSYDAHSITVPLFGQPPNPEVTAALDDTPYRLVAALAHQLAAGAPTQWEMVARVQRYLLDGNRFHYTTTPPQPGPDPLVDFLLHGHAGDCQHFAGAAALLLRLAGVPTRVAVGYATGMPHGDGRYEVRDVDAHAWIEVYFQGYGWVARNPTPPAAQAHIPRQLEPLAPTPATTSGDHHTRRGPGGLAMGALLVVALATAGAVLVCARRRGRPAELAPLLEALVGRTGGHVQTSSTLAELRVQLTRLVGPNIATLASHAEHARFAPGPPPPAPHPRIQIVRALTSDLGPVRALIVLVAPVATRRLRSRPPRTR